MKILDTELAAVAEDIARRLCTEAIWHEGRCNWVGPLQAEEPGGVPAIRYAALGPDLYGGTPGIAWFLAETSVAIGDEEAKRTAIGAIEQALFKCLQTETHAPGLYGGSLGVALAAAHVEARLQTERFRPAIRQILAAVPEPDARPREFDLIAGDAGEALAFIALARLLEDPTLLERAAQAGRALLGRGRPVRGARNACAWRSPASPHQPPLCGLSHGAAGGAYALYELHCATGEPRFRQGAERALAYERTLFDAEAENWPDLRERPDGAPANGSSFSVSWCHGAPGIALSRLRAYELSAEEQHREEATIALRTTYRALRDSVSAHFGNYSLCHGLAGNAEILLRGLEVPTVSPIDARALVLEVAEDGRERHARPRSPWPCGLPRTEPQGLMLGLAGIGLFYLRLCTRGTASLLDPARLHADRASAPASAARHHGPLLQVDGPCGGSRS